MFVKNPEYFLAIVKERSISKAADRLYPVSYTHLTLPTIYSV